MPVALRSSYQIMVQELRPLSSRMATAMAHSTTVSAAYSFTSSSQRSGSAASHLGTISTNRYAVLPLFIVYSFVMSSCFFDESFQWMLFIWSPMRYERMSLTSLRSAPNTVFAESVSTSAAPLSAAPGISMRRGTTNIGA